MDITLNRMVTGLFVANFSILRQARMAGVSLLLFVKRSAFSVLALWIVFSISAVFAAQTSVSGVIESNTRWTKDGQPYVVTADLTIQNGALLTIDPGVNIYMGSNASILVLSGGIQALGTEANPIRVLSTKTLLGQLAAPGDWRQWVFGAGAVNVSLNHVFFENGKGLLVNGSAPILNYLTIKDQLGAAITVDLDASPTGVGNIAIGNTLNGIAVPSGDVTKSVKWGVKGIPYIVSNGVVSVGSSPFVQEVSPTSIEQGQVVNLTIKGGRLEGLSQAKVDGVGVFLTPFSGASANQISFQLKADVDATLGKRGLRFMTDAGEVVIANALTVVPPMPNVSSLQPATVLAGNGLSELTVLGRNFTAATEVIINSASVPTQFVSASELRITLPNQTTIGSLQIQARSPDLLNSGQYLTSNVVALVVQAPIPPVVSVEPTPIALPPDGKAREIVVRLSKADYRDHTLALSISDSNKATVSPATLLIPAGQTTAKISITPKLDGTVSLIADSSTLQRVSVPLFITADFRGANSAYATPVGVVLEGGTAPIVTKQITVQDPRVGVSLGAVLKRTAPAASIIGSKSKHTLYGFGIPENVQVSLSPSNGALINNVMVSPSGETLQFELTTTEDATVGKRRLLVKDAANKELVFADPSLAMFDLLVGSPVVESVDPLFAVRGSTIKMKIRGRNLHLANLKALSGLGLALDAQPEIAADGSQITAFVEVAAGAPLGSQVIQVETPVGLSASQANEANSLTIVSALGGSITPIITPLVGVMVGDTVSPPKPIQFDPNSARIGVVLGAGVSEVIPNAGVIGTDTQVVVRGSGLKGVDNVGFVPSAGISLQGVPTSNVEGTELRFIIRVEANAELGVRRLVLREQGMPITFSRFTDAVFLVSAPLPELQSVAPQVIQSGQATTIVSLRGQNLLNVSAIRIEPSQGLTVSEPFVSADEGRLLTFNLTAAADAQSGSRTVIVTTAAGDSSIEAGVGNSLRIAKEIGNSYSNISAPLVGVVVGEDAPQIRSDVMLISEQVGVMVGESLPPEQVSFTGTVAANTIGVVIGSASNGITPNGILQGGSADIVVTGYGLDEVVSVSVSPSTGVILGSLQSSEGGTRLTVPVAVAPDAAQTMRTLILLDASGRRIASVALTNTAFGIGILPTLNSVSPLNFERGKQAVLTVRGTNLKGVNRVVFAPNEGIRSLDDLVWSQDSFGEKLAVTIVTDADAVLGGRVIQLEVFGGATSAEGTSANSVSVVVPQ